MRPRDRELGRIDDAGEDEPLENPPLDWAEEDREIEDRKPDLGEIEEDPSAL